MKKILVPCDFSRPAINAFRFALSIAEQSNGTINLINVIELPVLIDPILIPMPDYQEGLKAELQEKAKRELQKIVEKYNTEKIQVINEVLFGISAKTILGRIMEGKFDIVIMGSHGASGLREYLIGSNAEKIVRSSTAPVLVLKDHYKGPIKNIVFPNTLETDNQEELISKVKNLQQFFKAHLQIVWINTPVNFTSDSVTNQRLRDFAKRFELKDYTVNVFNHPDEEEGIIEFTRMVKGDLIALGTHGRKGISHLINGSLAEDVVNHTQNLIWTYSMKHVLIEA